MHIGGLFLWSLDSDKHKLTKGTDVCVKNFPVPSLDHCFLRCHVRGSVPSWNKHMPAEASLGAGSQQVLLSLLLRGHLLRAGHLWSCRRCCQQGLGGGCGGVRCARVHVRWWSWEVVDDRSLCQGAWQGAWRLHTGRRRMPRAAAGRWAALLSGQL